MGMSSRGLHRVDRSPPFGYDQVHVSIRSQKKQELAAIKFVNVCMYVCMYVCM